MQVDNLEHFCVTNVATKNLRSNWCQLFNLICNSMWDKKGLTSEIEFSNIVDVPLARITKTDFVLPSNPHLDFISTHLPIGLQCCIKMSKQETRSRWLIAWMTEELDLPENEKLVQRIKWNHASNPHLDFIPLNCPSDPNVESKCPNKKLIYVDW